MNNSLSAHHTKDTGTKSFFFWLFSAVIGSIGALELTPIIIPLIYGVEYHDRSAFWLPPAFYEVVTGIICLPAFFLAHLLSYRAFRFRDPAKSASLAIVIGIAVFLPVVVGAWYVRGSDDLGARKAHRAR